MFDQLEGTKMIDLAIAYRIYPGISKSPAAFSTDKFRLSRMCLESFKRAIGGLKVKVWALLDGCPPEYEQLFRETLHNVDLAILPLNKIGNLASFSLQIDLLTQQAKAHYVYFAEDDYFYLPDALEKMIEFMRENRDADFVTPYDHPDSYDTSSRFERHLVRPFGDRYWRTASSTCLTFLTSTQRLKSSHSTFRTYSRGNGDYPMWCALTRRLELLDHRVHADDSFRLKAWLKIWRWGYPALLFRRRYRLWSPLPTLATHMESSRLSPLIDWPTVFRSFEDERGTR